MSKKISVLPEKLTMVDNDHFTIVDSEDGNVSTKNKKVKKQVALGGMQPAAPAGNQLGVSGGWTPAGDSATRNVGTESTDVAAGDAPANAVSSHNSDAGAHSGNIPTTAQKAALDNASPALSSVNPVSSQSNLDAHKTSADHDGRYPPVSRRIGTTNSIQGGGDLSADRTLQLDGDEAVPGNDQYYGTNGSGVKGFHSFPSAGSTAFTDLIDTPNDYAGSAGKLVKVDALGQELIFGDPSGVSVAWGDITGGDPYAQTDLGAELNAKISEAPNDGDFYVRSGEAWAIQPQSPIGTVWAEYAWSADTGATKPGAGLVKVNNADHTLATELYVDELTGGGNSSAFLWDEIQAGDFIGVWERDKDKEGIYYAVTGPAVKSTDWYTVPISAVFNWPGGMEAGSTCAVFAVRDFSNRNPVGGATGQVLRKVSNANHDTQWADETAAPVDNPMTSDLDLGLSSIVTSSNAHITLAPDGTGEVQVVDAPLRLYTTNQSGGVAAIVFDGGSAAVNRLTSAGTLLVSGQTQLNLAANEVVGAAVTPSAVELKTDMTVDGDNAHALFADAARPTSIFTYSLDAKTGVTVPEEAYGPSWDGSFSVPTKNAVYDKIETLGGGGGWVDGSEILHWIDTQHLLGSVGTNQTVPLTSGHTVDVALTADIDIDFTATIAAGDSRNWSCLIDTGGFTPTFKFNGVALGVTMDWWDISADAVYLVTFTAGSVNAYITGLAKLT